MSLLTFKGIRNLLYRAPETDNLAIVVEDLNCFGANSHFDVIEFLKVLRLNKQ